MIARLKRAARNPGTPGAGVLYLVIAIPLTAVIMGVFTLYLAFSNADPGVEMEQQPLSKTSWRAEP